MAVGFGLVVLGLVVGLLAVGFGAVLRRVVVVVLAVVVLCGALIRIG